MLTSPRLGILYPNPATRADTADVPRDIKALLDKIELSTLYGQGLLADRPVSTSGSPGIQGRIYYATDTSLAYWDYGTGWIALGAQPPFHTADIADAQISTAKLIDGSVTSAKIADGAITSADIADGTIAATDLADVLVPSRGAGGATEALRALGTAAGRAAAGIHASQHAPLGADPLAVSDDWIKYVNPLVGGNSNVNFDTWSIGNGNETMSSDGSQNAEIVFKVSLPDGTWKVVLIHVPQPSTGIYTVQFDGVTVGSIDGWSSSVAGNWARSSIGGIVVAKLGAATTVKLLMATKNVNASGYFGVIGKLAFIRTA